MAPPVECRLEEAGTLLAKARVRAQARRGPAALPPGLRVTPAATAAQRVEATKPAARAARQVRAAGPARWVERERAAHSVQVVRRGRAVPQLRLAPTARRSSTIASGRTAREH